MIFQAPAPDPNSPTPHRNLATLGMDGMLDRLLLICFTRCGFLLAQKTKTRSRITMASVTPTAIPTKRATERQKLIRTKKCFYSVNVFRTLKNKIYPKHRQR